MADIKRNLSELIGNTPMLELGRIGKAFSSGARLLAKLEYFNPAGSVKDRIARSMIEDAEAKGLIGPHTTIIEPTSGNTGIGLAAVAAFKGYRLILVLPETASVAHQNLLRMYGAEIVLTDGTKGVKESIRKAEEIAAQTRDSFIPGQFVNPQNPAAHYASTGPEIWNQTGGQVDYFVAGVGTGGTVTGAGNFLKAAKPTVKVVAVEPAASPFLSEGKSGPHKIQGIGAGFAPAVLDTHVYDEIIRVTDGDAVAMMGTIARTEGILVGTSSGAALRAALDIAKRSEAHGKTIVVLLPDSGERYVLNE
ncbi:MAG: cysteine synthase A [Spirochaetaceae bacterium]|jgi:cysteine synthase A|nr:cysteine synthase A [Spirochaetaceae bacterium]